MSMRFVWVGLLLVLQLVVGFGGWISPAYALTDEQKLFNEVWRIVNRAYVDETFNHQNWWVVRQKALQQPLNTRQDTYTAIAQMLKTLDDPFTRFLDPEQYKSLQVNTSGELTGVGLQIALEPQTKVLLVISPIAGSPAEAAGLQPLDRILRIDGIPTEQLSLEEAAQKMRGMAGSLVSLLVERDGAGQFEVKLKRDHITLNPVVAELRETEVNNHSFSLGYIRLGQFNAYATKEVASAIAVLEQQGAQGYILDLRNNPGGLLQSGIEVARLWMDGGTVVHVVNRQGIQDSFEAAGNSLTHKPLVVLVNQGTASASEILAGALQDNHRAFLVGEKTFGKGVIQSLFDLSDGSGLAVTVAKYETPNHHDINKLGIQPDRVVPLNPITRDQIGTASDQQYQAAVELLVTNQTLAKAA